MNDVTTTEKPATAEKKRVHRYYITPEDVLISRLAGVDADIVDLDDPILRRKALIAEAIIGLLTRGYTLANILNGTALPDRSLPAPAKTATPHTSPKLIRAVVGARAERLMQMAKENGEKLTREQAEAAAMTQVNALSSDARARAAKALDELFDGTGAAA